MLRVIIAMQLPVQYPEGGTFEELEPGQEHWIVAWERKRQEPRGSAKSQRGSEARVRILDLSPRTVQSQWHAGEFIAMTEGCRVSWRGESNGPSP